MPIRVKSKPQPGAHDPPRSPSPRAGPRQYHYGLPDIQDDDSLRVLIKKLSTYFNSSVTLSVTFEQLRTTSAGECLQLLVEHLSRCCRNPAVVHGLLALKWHYGAAKEEKSVNEARAFAAEIVAWRFLTHLSEREVVEFCLYEIPDPDHDEELGQGGGGRDEENGLRSEDVDENTALLSRTLTGSVKSAESPSRRIGTSKRYQLLRSISRLTTFGDSDDEEEEEEDPTKPFVNLNALEIAAVADAKRFLAQHVIQKMITSIWNGNIVFWDQLTIDSVKKPRFYNRATADPFSRLRVPKYLKSYEVVFFLVFLFLYYAVLVERNPDKVSLPEILLYVWFAAFAYDELSEWIDAGSIFYTTDVWNLFDITMILIGIVFAVMRIVGLSRHDGPIIAKSFDVLSLEALFMIPRVASILSLSPYWGTLIPCLKEMGKDFVKFMVLVLILYLGFLTTFSLIGREHFDLKSMAFILSKIFYGSTYLGFDYMNDIDPLLGPPLMYIFVTLSSILLMGSLTGMLSNSFSRVISHAREEYLYVYSVYVLEASTSNRLTHFYPPFNLLPLLTIRPLRLLYAPNNTLRGARILLLKATHLPIVGAIYLYEFVVGHVTSDAYAGFKGPRTESAAGGASSHHNNSNNTLQNKSSRNKMRPASSSGGGGSQRQVRSANRMSMSVCEPLPPTRVASMRPYAVHPSSSSTTTVAAAALGDAANDDVDAPTEMDVRIAELSGKIDRLTDIILAMQAERYGGAEQP